MAFNFEETVESVFIEIKLPDEECDILNTELDREVNYWKELAVKGAEDPKLLEFEAPKRRRLRSKKDRTMKVKDIENILKELKAKYKNETPELIYLPAVPSHQIKTLAEIEPFIKEYSALFRKTDNFLIKNAYTFGTWLRLTERIFKHERYIMHNSAIPKQFGLWIKSFGISRQSADVYKKLCKLVEKAPRLINCQVSINFVMKNYDHLKTYVWNKESAWKHNLECICKICKEYFG